MYKCIQTTQLDKWNQMASILRRILTAIVSNVANCRCSSDVLLGSIIGPRVSSLWQTLPMMLNLFIPSSSLQVVHIEDPQLVVSETLCPVQGDWSVHLMTSWNFTCLVWHRDHTVKGRRSSTTDTYSSADATDEDGYLQVGSSEHSGHIQMRSSSAGDALELLRIRRNLEARNEVRNQPPPLMAPRKLWLDSWS